jgi:hypothetical protein
MKSKVRSGMVGVLSVLAIAGSMLGGCSKEVKIEWSCQGTTKNSMQCTIKNTGATSGEACFDIVQVCAKGEHVAKVCSGRIDPGSMENKVVTSFSPAIGLLETCMGTEFRNKRVTAR